MFQWSKSYRTFVEFRQQNGEPVMICLNDITSFESRGSELTMVSSIGGQYHIIKCPYTEFHQVLSQNQTKEHD